MRRRRPAEGWCLNPTAESSTVGRHTADRNHGTEAPVEGTRERLKTRSMAPKCSANGTRLTG
jgi:hypothetical protein